MVNVWDDNVEKITENELIDALKLLVKWWKEDKERTEIKKKKEKEKHDFYFGEELQAGTDIYDIEYLLEKLEK